MKIPSWVPIAAWWIFLFALTPWALKWAEAYARWVWS